MKRLYTYKGIVELSAEPEFEGEVFIGGDTMHRTLADGGYSTIATSGLWNALVRNTGIYLTTNGSVQRTDERKLYCVRRIEEEGLISIDGLVDGMLTTEILDGKKIGPQRIGAILLLAKEFTAPQRTDDILAAEELLHNEFSVLLRDR